ncbi:MAG: HDIG domain-containing metalloprotein [Planctomycetales bacterium]
MALFAHKKSRTSRAVAFRTTDSAGARLARLLRDRGVVLRLAMCLVAIVALVAAVEGWKAPFDYRLGDRAFHGIAAKVRFERVDEEETERRRRDSEAQQPFVFEHDPNVLAGLPATLRTHLGEIAQADRLSEVPVETRVAFGLVADGPGPFGAPAEDMGRGFASLKDAVSGEMGTAGNRIAEIIAEFTEFVGPFRRNGVIVDPEDLDREGIRFDQTLRIETAVEPDGAEQPAAMSFDLVTPADVLLPELIKDTGLLGKSWSSYQKLAAIRPQLEAWLKSQASSTLRFDRAATDELRRQARESVKPVRHPYDQGDMLVRPGAVIDNQALVLLRAEYDRAEDEVSFRQRIARVVTVFLLISVLAALNGYYLVRNEPQLVRSPGRLGVYLLTLVLAVALARLLSFDPWRAEVIPVLAVAMVFAITYHQVLATITAFTLALVVSLSTVAELGHFVVLMGVSTTAIVMLRQVSSRSKLIKVGFWSGVSYFVLAWGTGILESQSIGEIWADPDLLLAGLRGAAWCLVTGYLVAGSLPFIESAFGVVTDISLLEMSDISHPLLQELVRRAPGTYNHSISVATIAEAAADRIGANGLLVRVGAYFHDIGKMLKPQYFIENMTEGMESRHRHLAPAMSTLIIIGHVKDGVDLARQHHLPRPIVDFIEQHHGTTLVEYFYREATRKAEGERDHRTDAEESSFRYPGPKPQTREAGVLMLADAVESASRTLSDPTPRRIEGLVHELTMKRLLDGQFDECALTLSHIHQVEESLIKSLIAIYHGRIKYPAQRTA